MWESEHLIWIVCAAFYLTDHVKFIEPKRLVVIFGRRSRLPLLPLYGFLIRNRAFTLLNPLQPWSTSVYLSWLSYGRCDRVGAIRHARKIRIATGRLFIARASACVVFACLFIIGPVVTEIRGIGSAVFLVVPVLLGAWLIALANLLACRRVLGLGWMQVFGFMLECLLCPGYFANLWRRLLLERLASEVDAVFLSLPAMSATQIHLLRSSLDSYLTDLRERGLMDVADEAVAKQYSNMIDAVIEQDASVI